MSPVNTKKALLPLLVLVMAAGWCLVVRNDSAEAQVQIRRHVLDAALRELARATITARTDGIVVSRSVDVGQTVAASLSARERRFAR
jgi:multidrug efflux pump subunit AcrA (membrane-fusion protein)